MKKIIAVNSNVSKAAKAFDRVSKAQPSARKSRREWKRFFNSLEKEMHA